MGGGPKYLGVIPHPSLGIRVPEILLKGILEALKSSDTVGGLMLSFGRETAPEYVINAPPGRYEISMGHTGTSIKKYITMAAEASEREGVTIEIEGDHLTVTGSSAKAVKRISGVKVEEGLSREELESSLKYIKSEIDEAVSTGKINAFTIDTCELIRHDVDGLRGEDLKELFEMEFPGEDGRDMLYRYLHRSFNFKGPTGKRLSLTFSEEEVMRLALKFKDSIEVGLRIYRYLREKLKDPFGLEIALDETSELTRPKELLFYLNEWMRRGGHVDFVAPNIGFKKREDFKGDLSSLEERVEELHAIASSNGVLLSIHSGSGSTPYSGKGPGTYEALLKATSGLIKYKISGVYMELVFSLMASSPKGSRPRRLYEEIFDRVHEYLVRECERGGPLSSPLLKEQLRAYEEEVRKGVREERDPRSDFFRYYSFIALNLRDGEERRLRASLVELYEEDEEFRGKVDKEVKELTLRLINGLGFSGNVKYLREL